MKKTTLVLGASTNPSRYSYIAIKRLVDHGEPVKAIGLKEGIVQNIRIIKEKKHFDDIETVTLYLNPKRQEEYYDYIISLEPKRVIFNPGTENPVFYKMLGDKNIEPVVACTLVMLSTNQY
ncbi:MAG TPA: CoA-binding protein [Salinimicrobium sp.]|nr:CoA-binding protein [Salinimicrobium sp.]